jgi:hypothetical protein
VSGVLLKPSEQHWLCPNCTQTQVTRNVRATVTPFHSCRGLRGLQAPLVLDGTRCKVVAREREDYVGREVVTTDGEGRPVMSVVTTRDDGEDCAVFAPAATATEGR